MGLKGQSNPKQIKSSQQLITPNHVRRLIEIVPDPLVTIDRDGKIMDVNAALEHVTGEPRGRLIGSDFCTYFTEPEKAREAYRRAFVEEQTRDCELTFRNASGKTTDVIINAVVYRDDTGKVAGVFAAARDISERKRAEEKELATARYARNLIEASLDPLFAISPEGKITDVNRATEEATGLSRSGLIGTDVADYFTEPDKARAGYREAFGKGEVRDYPLTIRHVSGRAMDVLYNATVYRNLRGDVAGVFAAGRDVTDRRRAEGKLQRAVKALLTLSACNEALIRATDEQSLLQEICMVVVEAGGYRFAWVGYAENDAGKSVRPMAQAGFGADYLETVRITWADAPRGQGPTGTAIRTSRGRTCSDITTDPALEPWRADALARGYRSSIALPLCLNGGTLGALTIYAAVPNAFDGDAASLLGELAKDLAYGIGAIRAQDARTQAEKALAESEEKFRAVTNAAQDAIVMIDERGSITYWNPAAERIFGYTSEEAAGKRLHQWLAPVQDREAAAKGFEQFAKTGQGPVVGKVLELFAVRNDGQEIPIELSVGAVPLDGKWHAVGVIRDIVERKQAEAERLREVEARRQALVQTIQAIALTVEKRDPYTAGHQRRVAEFARAIAQRLKLPEERIDGLYMASLIHDIGKIEIPAEILARPGELTAAQNALVKTHSQAGYDIMKNVDMPWPVAATILQHHERLDGSGYPKGAKGDEICLEARIVGVADVVEAMMSHRPYRPALGLDAALTEITSGRGTRYDAAVVDACVALIRDDKFAFPQVT